MNLIKALGALAVAGIAAGVVIKNDLDEKRKGKELDEFLMADESEAVEVEIPETTDKLERDIYSIDKNSATLTFTLADKDKCLLFQDLLSEKGLSSDFKSDELRVNVFFNNEVTTDNLTELLLDLRNVLDKVDAKYEGCL